MNNKLWNHHNPVRITSGPGALSQLPDLVSSTGNLLLITTPGFTRRGVTSRMLSLLGKNRTMVYDQATPNPDLDNLDQVIREYRGQEIAGIIALGGGSVLDAGKVLGAIFTRSYTHPLNAILREGEKNEPSRSIPVTAIPTTAGTGAEATPFATVWDGKRKKKHSLSGQHIFPTHALLDPELTMSLPYRETLYPGLDTISHALESLWNKDRTCISEAYALHALHLSNAALPITLEQPNKLEHRSTMQEASLLAGLAISQTRTAIAHSISYPVTIHYGIPHGLACSFTLPELIRRYSATLPQGIEKQTIQSTLETLDRVGLANETARLPSHKDLLWHINEMFDPQRADNFVEQLDQKEVARILKASVSRSPRSVVRGP